MNLPTVLYIDVKKLKSTAFTRPVVRPTFPTFTLASNQHSSWRQAHKGVSN